MDTAVALKIFETQETARTDETYRQLMQEHEILNARFLQTVEALPKAQQTAVYDYLGLVTQMHLRLLELACG